MDDNYASYLRFCETYKVNYTLSKQIQQHLIENQELANRLTRMEVSTPKLTLFGRSSKTSAKKSRPTTVVVLTTTTITRGDMRHGNTTTIRPVR